MDVGTADAGRRKRKSGADDRRVACKWAGNFAAIFLSLKFAVKNEHLRVDAQEQRIRRK